ncbi:DEAD/DEAH box helicase [Tessaracoccus massiliensis]|uniref:DEAD/DEAH box helicase n=1 Tax=Tessaracoccus massiliensis TaxID=1522311 RepID=UPI00058D52C0|nr:DEAD/DEAH box helicase [Tessaracoccus massiliensis]
MTTTYPDWVPRLTDADLTLHFGAPTVARGAHYANLGRVTKIQTAGPLATAQVRGSNFRQYHTSVTLNRGVLTATCSCPMRADCKHAVALILSMRTPALNRPQTSWRSLLQPLMDKPTVTDGAPMALIFGEDGAELGLTPARLGARGNWVRSGVTWPEIVRGPANLSPAHLDAVRGILEARDLSRGAAHWYPQVLQFNDLGPSIWEALRRAAGAGVEFIPGTSASGRQMPQPTIPAKPLEPTLLVRRDDGGLRLVPAVLDGEVAVEVTGRGLLGRPAHGATFTRGDQLVLGPLSRTLEPAEQRVFSHGPLTVPEHEEATFAAGFLPQLRRRLPVQVADGVALPEPEPPALLLQVDFTDDAATLAWGFRYRVGSTVIDVPLHARTSEPHPRDYGAEAELLPLAASPWLPPLSQRRPELTTLAGRNLIGFVTETLPHLQDSPLVEVETTGEPRSYREADEAPGIELKVTESQQDDWFDLGVDVTVGGERVPLAQLLAALTAGEDHLVLDSGVWFSLEVPELAQLRELLDEASQLIEHDGDTIRLRPEHAGLWDELVSLGVVAEQSAAWQQAVGGLLDPSSLPEVAAPVGLDAELRPYQDTGFRWMTFLWQTRLGGILADEMGLGKTLQSLAFLQAAHERGELTAPALVVAPTSVIGTWAAEAERFAPGLQVVPITETRKRRGTELAEAIEGAHLVVTSYTLLRLEEEAYLGQTWSAVLLDEAQFVKNHASKAYKAVRRLRARMKVALTGTPLENNLMDLWSLLSITAPGLFPDPKAFTTAFRKPIENGNREILARLHRRTRPLILRRTKATVAEELPDKQEQLVPVQLTPPHRRLYDKHLARERQKILGLVGDLNRNRIAILRSLTMLRQLSLSPALVDSSYPAASAKIDALLELLDEALSEGHRALVFSQFTGFLSLVRQRLDAEQITYEYLDGRTRDRAERISNFRTGDASLFLISLKAGGFGLTLTEADYVFILDPWWNPAAEAQAIDRTHRIGQDKPVNVYRLVAADTIEEKVVALQERKRALFDDVVGAGSDTAAPMTAADILGLLRE